jgi:protein-S-isoprenylcysteine O-methyltransferase Ste14
MAASWSHRAGGGEAPSPRPLTDYLLPSLLFVTLATLGGAGTLDRVARAPTDSSVASRLPHVLDAVHGVLAFVFFSLVAVLFLARREPLGRRGGPTARAVALAGTFVMSPVAAQPATTQDWRVLILADSLLVAGLAFSIYAAASLGRCFGLSAEARGLVTSGAYRLVRHPLYLGETVGAAGILLPVLAPVTFLTFGVFCLLQATRAVLEERTLTATFPEYGEYRRSTPALLPWPRRSASLSRCGRALRRPDQGKTNTVHCPPETA